MRLPHRKKQKYCFGASSFEKATEKAIALHDYIVLNIEYDCQGYALAYQYLLKKVGIESKYVASTAMNHGWNLVKIGGLWYHVDATWYYQGQRYYMDINTAKNYKAANKTVAVTVNPSGTSFTKYSNIKTRKLELQWKKNSCFQPYQ